jgi:ABC-type amino acid transport substrate-binding protein
MMARADNREINTVADLKDKVIGAQNFFDFAGAQAQFFVMYKNGVDFIVDPKQVIFTGKIVLYPTMIAKC